MNKTTAPKIFALVLSIVVLSGCGNGMRRLENLGKEPNLTEIKNPKMDPNYRRVSLPLPEDRPYENGPNALWNVGRKSFFKDQRASRIGDILTVMIDIKDKAELDNKSERSRNSDEQMDMPGLMGLETQLTKVLPEGTLPDNLVDLGSNSTNTGEGSIEREEEIELKIAALVIDVLPNENMVIHGRQEVRVNHEVRELQVTGVIRPEDISSNNTISYEKIAEARISYGGRGMISDVQQPRYGNEVLDILLPF
jgi:flagellar L-ring protein precursor FlgH